MDLEFFGLQEPPFNPAPNPRFLHFTPGHQEALAQLLYGVQQQKGFVLLTGEIGTGKTTLLKALVERLGDTTAVAFVANSMLDFEGILEYMLEDFGIAKPGQSTLAQRLVALQNFLIERQRAGQNTVLIVDEAHALGSQTLDRIRLLSNFETSSDKVLQIVLAGQPELRTTLELPELRQLKQRIGLRSRILPVSPEHVGDYIRTRLRVAGARDVGLFSRDAIASIAEYSGGTPRLVNIVCDHCLVFAYADQVRRIGPGIVDQAIQYLEEGERPRRSRGAVRSQQRMTPWRWAIIAASAAAAGLAVVYAVHAPTPWKLLELGTELARSARGLLPL